ncbi:MAG: hypothetical protein KF787_10515 [Phycisphaeraceae bacterium]|nr:alpha-glucosidase [Phycisphaerae bacterium]MBX3393068.1 hypothetical protein [Phycisphaeraceae bacterium]
MLHSRAWRLDPAPVLIADRVARHRDPAHAAAPAEPFPAYVATPVDSGPAPATARGRVRFTDRRGLSHAFIKIAPGTSLYATGEVAGPLNRNGKVTVCWNTDAFDYTDASRSLYQSHPFVLGVRRDGSAFGVIAQTTRWCRIDLRRGILFSTRGYSPPIAIIERESPDQVVRALADLTGHAPMPPRWALGYQQCRWTYEPRDRVLEIARGFREHSIPCDVIWLDIDAMDGFRCFTFDREKFPDPAGMMSELAGMGFHAVCMIDPGIKADPHYFVYAQGSTHGPHAAPRFVRTPGGDEYRGAVWPGPCAFPDFTSHRVRKWWAGLYGDWLATGIDGVWNDMNEPAIFDGPGKTMPVGCVHDADADLGGPGSHARYHNIYGMQMVRATREGIQAAQPGLRPFVLTRSNFLGGQRYAATWTGDNRSDWKHLRWAIPMALNLGLSGQPFAGPDIGGFVGNATPELFGRFMGIGALLPFARGHSIKGSADHEPWSFGPECEAVCRLALQRRYRLLPYLYTVFDESHRTGLPVVRPVFFADPTDPSLRGIEHAFLVGSDLLALASVHESTRETGPSPLPGWREFEIVGGGGSEPPISASRAHDQLPRLFLRPGAIIPIAKSAAHAGELDMRSLTLLAAPRKDGSAEGSVYHDDGLTLAYLRGDHEHAHYQAPPDPSGQTRIERRLDTTSRPSAIRAVNAFAVLPDGSITRVTRSGEA